MNKRDRNYWIILLLGTSVMLAVAIGILWLIGFWRSWGFNW